jgi:hypothetical protein
MIVEQVKILENHPHMLSYPVNINLRVSNQLSVKPDFTACGSLQKIQAAQKSAFTGTGGSHDYYLLAGMNMVIHTLQYVIVFKNFMQLLNDYHSF